MSIRPIKNAEDYEAALHRIEYLMDAAPDSAEADELEVLSIVVEDYEKRHYDIPAPDPIQAIKFRMEQGGLTRNDLVASFGSKSKVSEVLAGKRSLSLPMIRRLHERLNIPCEILICEQFAKFQASKAHKAHGKNSYRSIAAKRSPNGKKHVKAPKRTVE